MLIKIGRRSSPALAEASVLMGRRLSLNQLVVQRLLVSEGMLKASYKQS